MSSIAELAPKVSAVAQDPAPARPGGGAAATAPGLLLGNAPPAPLSPWHAARLHLALAEADSAGRAPVLRAPARAGPAAHGALAPTFVARAPAAIPLLLPAAAPGGAGLPLGERLLRQGSLAPADLVHALALQSVEETRLGEILVARGMATAADVMGAVADQWRAEPIDLARLRPDPRLIDLLGPDRCLAFGVVPIRRIGSVTLVAAAHPECFAAHRLTVEAALGPVTAALADESQVGDAICRVRGPSLALSAERATPADLSCREWRGRRTAAVALAGALAMAAAALVAPLTTLWALTAVVMTSLVATAALKGLALGELVRGLRRARHDPAGDASLTPDAAQPPYRLPRISVMVPLFEEERLAETLLPRLERLLYPRELTDILLLVERSDRATIAALRALRLPRHIRWLEVPPGTVMTKPRALNYGLGFARGEIIGIWDAEDAPDPDQLHVVARGFAGVGPRVACLQGALDFYNARTNWLSRCFTLEYGTWFRGFLPGLQGLGLPIPLGGTTLFFRRAAIEGLGGWDAHNVTEDADLGIRLYRAGFRTEIVATTTREEANCRLVPWIRQRSRWLKGYAITWAVHMRRPVRLWREMGAPAFLGFNALFLGTLVQFVLAPVMLSFWLLSLGAFHPLAGQVPPALGWACLGVFAATEAISTALTLIANRDRERRWLWWWVPALQAYYPLATLAAFKGLWELCSRPFWWDKTEHGLHGEDEGTEPGLARIPSE